MKTRLVLLFFALQATLAAQSVWIKPPSDAALKSTPGLRHFEFESEFMKTKVGYNVVFPPSYETRPDKRYPVVYWLHGGGGNESSSLYMVKYWADLYAAGEIDEVILVFPNGHRSGYMDHHDGSVMMESMMIKELIPRVDQTLRTIASREGRAVHGFSMGSSGALKFVIKYPNLFCSAAAGGGGAIDLEKSSDPFILKILERNFASDPELIRKNNTYRMLEANHAEIRRLGIRFLLVCGGADSWLKSATTFDAVLRERGIDCELVVVPEVAHNSRKVYEAEGARVARFQDEVFRRNAEGD